MNKVKYIALLLAFALMASCSYEIEDVFDKTPEERAKIEIDAVNKKLVDSKGGWIAYYQFNNYLNEEYLYMDFAEQNRVTMMLSKLKGNEVETEEMESSFAMRYTSNVNLVFDTECLLTQFAPLGGDFRFILSNNAADTITFEAINTELEGRGRLILVRAESENQYDETVVMRQRISNDLSRSFYRTIQLDGVDEVANFSFQVDARFEEAQGDGIKVSESGVSVDTDGFYLRNEYSLGGVEITHFLYNESKENFDVYSNDKRVGVLDYTNENPFSSWGNSFEQFMDEVDADHNSILIVPIAYSPDLDKLVKPLYEKESDGGISLFQLVIQPPLGSIVYSSLLGYDKNAWYKILPEYRNDGIDIVFDNAYGGEGKNYYEKVKPSLEQLCKSYTVVPRNGFYYFVQDANPAMSYVGKPQLRDSW